MSGPEIITSSRGGRKLLLNGNIYYRRDSKKGKIYWNCVRRSECSATAITYQVGQEIRVQKEGKHSHAPNQEVVSAERVINRLKRVAVEQPQATPAQILRDQLPAVQPGVLSQLPDRYFPQALPLPTLSPSPSFTSPYHALPRLWLQRELEEEVAEGETQRASS